MSADSGQIKKELLELVSKNVELNSPEGIAWLEKAANAFWKDKLEPGQTWEYTMEHGFKKTWIN